MKKFIVLWMVLGLLMVSSLALAGQSNTGCGLGAMLLGEQDGILMQLFVVTTNGTSGNQTFGITSGTSNCSKPSGIVQNERLERFVASNMDTLAQDIAAGQGETIETVAELMEVPEEKRSKFYAALQQNFSNIFTSEDVQSADVIDNIVKITSES